MTPEERQMLAGLFERINANSSAPRDAEAESFISDAVRKAPFSPYILAQTALVQQQALEAAAHRIAELEATAHEAAQQQGQGGFLGNLGRSLFGGGATSAPPRPDPNAYQGGPPPQQGYAPPPQQGYAPPPQQGYPPPPPPQYAAPRPGPWGGGAPAAPSGGGGFLQNAAATAAGVAGGVALGNLLGGLFGGHSGGGLFGGGGLGGAGLGGAGLPGGNETVNIFEAPQGGADPGQFDPGAPDDAGYIDDSSFDDGSGGGDGGGGFDDV
jgi:uncharacterized protein